MRILDPIHSIKSRLLLSFVLGGALPMLLSMWLLNAHAQQTLVSNAEQRILESAVTRDAMLDEHIGHFIRLNEYLAEIPAAISYLTQHAANGTVDDDTFTLANEEFYFFQDENWGRLHHVMLATPQGEIVLNPPRNGWSHGMPAEVMRQTQGPHIGQSIADIPELEHARTETVVTDFFSFQERDHFHQLIISPVRNRDGDCVGLVLMEISIEYVQSFVSDAFSIGETGTLYLSTIDGLRVVHNREDYDPTPITHPGFHAALESREPAVGWYQAESGKEVLGVFLASRIYPWVVCVELSRNEVYAPVRAQNRIFMLVAGGSFVGLLVILTLVGRGIWRPLQQVSQAANRVADGDVWHEIQIDRQDEIGQIQDAVEAMRVSLKQQIDQLDGEISERTAALEAANEQLKHDAERDRLTGLANRTAFTEALTDRVEHYFAGDGGSFAVLFFDFDRFKIVNDSLGHAAGDALLCSIADRFRAELRHSDMVARFGGDEFVVLMDGASGEAEIHNAADRLLRIFEKPHQIQGNLIVSTASIGLVVMHQRYRVADDLVRDADAAMYEAKLAGKGQVIEFDEAMFERVSHRMRLEQDLGSAIELGQLVLQYQPIVALEDLRLSGFEALVRWVHPEFGPVSPVEFIPVAEDTGQIVEIGAWVMREALWQMRLWDERFGVDPRRTINVNVAKRQLIHPEFLGMVGDALEMSGIDPRRLKIEITESTAIDPRSDMSGVIAQVRALGVQIAMDDFGTGHSSLSLLHEFDLDVLKIDKSFVQRSQDSREICAILQSIITLAQNTGMQIVAEGAETEEQVATLISLGCDLVQGYYFSKPLAADEAARFVGSPQFGGAGGHGGSLAA